MAMDAAKIFCISHCGNGADGCGGERKVKRVTVSESRICFCREWESLWGGVEMVDGN